MKNYVPSTPAFSNNDKRLLICSGFTVSVFSIAIGSIVSSLVSILRRAQVSSASRTTYSSSPTEASLHHHQILVPHHRIHHRSHPRRRPLPRVQRYYFNASSRQRGSRGVARIVGTKRKKKENEGHTQFGESGMCGRKRELAPKRSIFLLLRTFVSPGTYRHGAYNSSVSQDILRDPYNHVLQSILRDMSNWACKTIVHKSHKWARDTKLAQTGLSDPLARPVYIGLFPLRHPPLPSHIPPKNPILVLLPSFIIASESFPAFGTTGCLATRKSEIAAFFAQISHETTGGWPTAPDGPFAWGLCFKEEINPRVILVIPPTPNGLATQENLTREEVPFNFLVGKYVPTEADLAANRTAGYG
ncbi:hypothetical protein Fmac_006828 [Flemingia macrophylla]|uniref:Glycoside hydrolase family 19 catalytic domain-containing protein n=1 Tax=Flemingia macrophylla TaxID=520843 RepID=A0ABD1ND90_9FABA